MWHSMSAKETQETLQVDARKGLTSDEARERIEKHGKNELIKQKKQSLISKFIAQLSDYMIIILLVAAAVSFAVSYVGGEADYIDPIMILTIVIVNAVIGVFQENKAERAIDELKKLTQPHAKVKRDGEQKTVNIEDVAVGDVIIIETGDFIPADARLVSATQLKTDESALTGESAEIDKSAEVKLNKHASIGDRTNMVWQSTVVTQGRGEAVVVNTGMNTQTGKVAGLIMESESPRTPLQERLARTGKHLGVAAIFICTVIFLMGVLRRIEPFDMFMTSVSLAVAAIPEGLPAIVTIILSIGVRRMAQKNAIIRKMPAVETLGGATVICSDKTGTLTQNKMTVTEFYGNSAMLLELCSLCSNNVGATEKALTDAALRVGIDPQKLSEKYNRISEIPFNSERKQMTTVHKTENGYRIITKGAPEYVLQKCLISRDKRRDAEKKENEMAQNALRVIAVAYRDVENMPDNLECDFKFAGLVGMIDPPRPEVANAVKNCRKAGIKPVMITGDYLETAVAIARDTSIFLKGDFAATGREIDEMSDSKLTQNIEKYSVFARVTPQHKMRIVKAFQAKGHVVAMTGDGVNDAPALKIADIGCAMGKSGTEVAKGAADMVLTDDNFVTIVSAVKEGRSIYSNIKKTVHFLLSSNIGEIITIFTAIFLGWQSPLLAVQLLWINLVTDSLPAIALGMEKAEEDVMKKPPVDRRKSFFSDGLGLTIVLEGMMIGLISLIAFLVGVKIFADLSLGRTMAFATLSISQLIHAFSVRSEKSLFKIGFKGNVSLVRSFLVCVFLQVIVIANPIMAQIFKVSQLSFMQWTVTICLALIPFVVCEVQKMINCKTKE